MRPQTTRPCSVLITGASTGIGRACALHLARAGMRVFAGVRREEDAQALNEASSGAVVTLRLDVTDPISIAEATARVSEEVAGQGLRGLVNNAGIAIAGPLEFLDVDTVRRLFDVNVMGALAVTQAALPLLRTGRGRIVNMSSVSGLVTVPFLGPYAASKYALESLSDALRLELRPWGIWVSLVEPGRVLTPIWEKTGKAVHAAVARMPEEAESLYGPLLAHAFARAEPNGISAERVARKVAQALFSACPRRRYLVGRDARWAALIHRLPAWIVDRMICSGLPAYGPHGAGQRKP